MTSTGTFLIKLLCDFLKLLIIGEPTRGGSMEADTWGTREDVIQAYEPGQPLLHEA